METKKIVLFGAGQIGAMLSRLIGPDYTVLCFADNFEKKWGTETAGIPVVSVKNSLELAPDCVCTCVLDDERSGAMERQLRELGYRGEIIRPGNMRFFDVRTATMRLLAEQIREYEIPGDIAEVGVFRGDSAAVINAVFPERTLHLFDTFKGFPTADVLVEQNEGFSKAKPGDFSETSRSLVEERLPFPERAVFYEGYFPNTFRDCMTGQFAFVSLDVDLYAPTAAALPLFWERLSPGGVIMIHDVNSTQFTGAGKAVRDFCKEKGIYLFPVCDLHGSAVLRK